MASYYATESIDRLMDRGKLFSVKIEFNKSDRNYLKKFFYDNERKKHSKAKIHVLEKPCFKNLKIMGLKINERPKPARRHYKPATSSSRLPVSAHLTSTSRT